MELRSFCTRMGWQVYQEYTDQISGSKSEKDRLAFKQMFEDAAKRKFDVVLVWSLDRFSREGAMQAMHYVQRLDGCGIGFKSYTEQYLDSTGIFREALISLIATLAKHERVRLSDRVKAGLARAKAEGRQGGRPELSKDKASQIVALKEQGFSLRAISRKLKISDHTVKKYLLI
jgi:DNA invertase Pin-like site-specific DNA recombinase